MQEEEEEQVTAAPEERLFYYEIVVDEAANEPVTLSVRSDHRKRKCPLSLLPHVLPMS